LAQFGECCAGLLVMTARYPAVAGALARWRPTRKSYQAVFLLMPTALPVLLALLAGRDNTRFFVGFSLCLVLITTGIWFCRFRPVLLIAGLALWLVTARLILASMTELLTPTTLSVLLAYGHFFFPILLLVLINRVPLAWRSAPPVIRCLDVAAIAFLVVVTLAVAFGTEPILDRIVYARRFTVLPSIYLAIRLLPIARGDTLRLATIGVAAGVCLAIFGLIERFLAGGFVWGSLADPVAYYQMASYSGSAREIRIINGLPLTFWTFDGGHLLRRLVSTSLEASTVAAFFAFVTSLGVALVGVAFSGWRAIMFVGICALATILTLGKAGIAIAIVSISYTLAVRAIPALRRPRWVVALTLAAAMGLLVFGTLVEVAAVASSVGAHLSGLRAGIESLAAHPFGIGIGSTGVFAQNSQVAESGIGVLMAQLGWPGILMWTPWVIILGSAVIIRSDQIANAPFLGVAIGSAVIAFSATSMLTESANGLLWNWVFPLLAAFLLTESTVPYPRDRMQTL
jgi:hypothetical protein